MDERALTGVRVLELTQMEAGSSAGLLLGWLGAEVVKVESPEGDVGRRPRPWEPPDRDSLHFLLFNANKRGVVIDLKHIQGRELFLELVRGADVVLENFAPGALEKLNLDYPVLREVNRGIILARIKGFGLSGPHKDYHGWESTAQAAGGVMSANGLPDGEPLRVGVGICNSGSGLHAALAILAAIVQRQRTGEGQVVEVSMQEVAANFLRPRILDNYRFGSFAGRPGNSFAGHVPAGLYPCKPGGVNDYVYIYVFPNAEHQWQCFARAIGREDLIGDPRCRDSRTRFEHREEIDAITSAWTGQRTKQEAMRVLSEAGVACSAVLDSAEVLDDPHLNQRGAIVTVDHPAHGSYRMPGCPVRLSASPVTETTAPPLLGQHTAEVLSELLGMTAAQVAHLRERGAVR